MLLIQTGSLLLALNTEVIFVKPFTPAYFSFLLGCETDNNSLLLEFVLHTDMQLRV